MYLKHLVFDDQIAVGDPVTRRAIFLTEEQVLAYIADGQIEVHWPRKKRGKIQKLSWIGAPLKAQTNGTMTVAHAEDGPDMHSSAPYSNRHASDTNVENVWTHANRSKALRSIFFTVISACGGVSVTKKKQRVKRRKLRFER